jgi:hypothetical protein
MGKLLDIVKSAISESSGDPKHLLRISHTGSSVYHDPDDDFGYQSDSAFTHYKVQHPNGETQHVSIDHDNGSVIKHKKDPNRPNGACRGSEPDHYNKPEDHDHLENIAMIRSVITPKTKVKMIR